MNNPAASCEVSRFRDFIDFIEANFEEYDPQRFKTSLNDLRNHQSQESEISDDQAAKTVDLIKREMAK